MTVVLSRILTFGLLVGCLGNKPTNPENDSAPTTQDTADTVSDDSGLEDSSASPEEETDSGSEENVDDCDLEYGVDPFADAVVSYTPGQGAGFGQDSYPEIVLGPPYGAGENAGSLDVLSLGENGSITLKMEDWIAIDGQGPDIIVFENGFIGWAEPGIVSASVDGENWVAWPCDASDVDNNYPGCAGVTPTLSHPDNCIDATDPTVAGGDAFDLADIGLESAAYIRIQDAGVSGPGGFDLDAVSVVNGQAP